MEYQWNKCYSIGANRTNRRVECTSKRPEANETIMGFILPVKYQKNKCYSIGSNRTNGQVNAPNST